MKTLGKFFTPPSLILSLLTLGAIISGNNVFLGILLYIVTIILIGKYFKWDSNTYALGFVGGWVPLFFFISFFPVSLFILIFMFADKK